MGHGVAYEFNWEIDETPEGSESATVVEPVQVVVLDEAIAVPSHSAALKLMQKYSVHLGPEWGPGHAYRLLQTFESIPQIQNNPYEENPDLPASVWRLSSRHILNEKEVIFVGLRDFHVQERTPFLFLVVSSAPVSMQMTSSTPAHSPQANGSPDSSRQRAIA